MHLQLDQSFAVDASHNDGTVGRVQRAIDDQNIVVMDSRVDHGVAVHADKIGTGGVRNHQFIQVQWRFQILLSRAWKPADTFSTIKGGKFVFFSS